MSTTYTTKTFCKNFNLLPTYLKVFLKKSKLDFLAGTSQMSTVKCVAAEIFTEIYIYIYFF